MSDTATLICEPEILCEKHGSAGVITLNRPKALNALTLGMVRGLAAALDAWEHDPEVTRIILTGAGERAFCAGGDIRQIHDCGKAGRQHEAVAFWREEYVLNARIKYYPKPYITLIDGIVMGGGVGISLHGSHRVAGDRFMFAMPEVGIGLFPDVGATYALPHLPGRTGLWLALTGARIKRADALALGIATHGVPSSALPAVRDALIAGEDVDAVLMAHQAPAETPPCAAHRTIIDECFAGASVADIIARLQAAGLENEFAAEAAQTITAKSPTSLLITFEQMKRGRSLDFAECIQLEYRIVSRILDGHDFYEGVRAVVIDKDQKPAWSPAKLDDVPMQFIESYFAPVTDPLPL